MTNETTRFELTPRKPSLSEQLSQILYGPSEEEIYKSSLEETFWSIDEFAALMSGLTPENYRKDTKGN